MSKELMYVLIAKMHIKLNRIIESNNFNLLSEEVQQYSKRLDKVLSRYNKLLGDTAESLYDRYVSCNNNSTITPEL